MGSLRLMVLTVFLGVMCVACSTDWPQTRMAHYLGPVLASETSVPDLSNIKGKKAGLVVINDTTAEGSAPELSKESFEGITQHVQARFAKAVGLEVENLNPFLTSASDLEKESLLQLAKQHQVDFVVLTVLSSTEVEVPERLPFQASGLGAIGQGLLSGYRAENYALAELALLDVQKGNSLIQANGQSWASLERLAVPLESNVYPVVRRNLEVPPIYPTREDRAHDVMRAVASSDAIDQAVMHFQETWKRVTALAG